MKKEFIWLALLLFTSCGEEKGDENKMIEWDQKKSTELNKTLAMEEEIQIDLFLEQHKDWKMIKTGSGLRYYIYEQGEGPLAQVGQEAQVEFEITLLDGTECYKTGSDEYDVFKIDRAEVESGVHEGVKKMRQGDRAKLIIPSHLAHGLIGDMNKIPPLTPIVVDLHLKSLL